MNDSKDSDSKRTESAQEFVCGRCEAPMEEGLVVDQADGGHWGQPFWLEGAPKRGFFGIMGQGKRKFKVRALRCPNCMRLEFYATERMY